VVSLTQNVAHLSWARIEGSTVRVDARRIAEDVMTVMAAFVERLEEISSPHAEWFRTEINFATTLLQPLPTGRMAYSTSSDEGVVMLRSWAVNDALDR
jgi:hypothetical protein